MTIVRSIAGIRAPIGTLARLAPGALLLLAITGADSAVAGEIWHLDGATTTTATRAAGNTLTATLAHAVGIASGAEVHTTIVCGGLAHHERAVLALVLETETHLPWTMLLSAEEARGEELRFITGRIDPPLPRWNHG